MPKLAILASTKSVHYFGGGALDSHQRYPQRFGYKKDKNPLIVIYLLTFAILGYHGAVETPTRYLDRPFAQESFDEAQRVAVVFGTMAQPSKFALRKVKDSKKLRTAQRHSFLANIVHSPRPKSKPVILSLA
jgi:hypothetical protein